MSKELAINGGPKTVTNNKINWPNFDEKAIKNVENVLRSGKVNYWTGPRGMEFEKKYAEWQGSKYAISVATGTAALTAFASLKSSVTVALGHKIGKYKAMTQASNKTFLAADVLGFNSKTVIATKAGKYSFIVRYKEK